MLLSQVITNKGIARIGKKEPIAGAAASTQLDGFDIDARVILGVTAGGGKFAENARPAWLGELGLNTAKSHFRLSRLDQ